MYKSLVIKGGGILITAEIGALTAVYEAGLLNGIKRVAGTSAGSIIATLFALGYNPIDLSSMVMAIDFRKFEDSANIFELLTGKHGLYRGRYFQDWIEGYISVKAGKSFATFKDLFDKGFMDLNVVTTYLNQGEVMICSHANTPNVIVSESVRASMSIPILFDRFRFTQGIDSKKDFQDGGVLLNYPIELYDGEPPEEVLGIYPHDITGYKPPLFVDGEGLYKYARATFEASMNAQDAAIFQNAKWMKQTILVDNLGISSTNFKVTPEDKQRLYNSGLRCANEFIHGKS